MSAAEALKAARAVGIHLEVDGDDLVLEASAPPSSAIVEVLSQHKAEIVAVLRQYPQDGGGWRRGCLQHQVVAVNFEVNTDSASCLQSFSRAHIRPVQGGTVFSTDGARGGEGVKGGDLTSTTRHAVRPSASAC